jgi:hypothetical protein
MTREEFLTAAEIAFERLMSPSRGLKPEQMEQPMGDGQWSLKELAAHLIFWNGLIVTALEARFHGELFDWSAYQDFDRLNAEAVGRMQGESLKRVLYELRVTHSAALEIVRRLTADKLLEDDQVPEWLCEIMLQHYEHHIPGVEAWAKRLKSAAQNK